MKYIVGLLLSVICTGISASALEVESGNLRNVVEDKAVATIVLTGTMNASDFDFIANEMTELTMLDLSGIAIEAYEGEPILMGQTSYPANTIPAYAFAGSKLQSIVLPMGLTGIGESAFATTPLAEMVFPSTLKTIEMGAFSNCDALEAIEFPDGVELLGSHAMDDCANLTMVKIGQGIKTIPEAAFARCGQLAVVEIAAVEEIGHAAFSGCESLKSMSFPATLTKIGNNAFEQSGIESVDLSACSSLASVGDWAFARCENLAMVSLGDNVDIIGEGVFFDDVNLADVAIPAAVTSLPAYMLKGAVSADVAMVVTDGIESIGDYALMGWSQVSKMIMPSSIVYIGDNAFEDWTSLTLIDVKSLSAVPELGENVWADVDQSTAILSVMDNMSQSFQSAEQWKEFSFDIVTASDEIDADVKASVYVIFEGADLVVRSTKDIAVVRLYNMHGQQLAYVEPDYTEAVIDTYDMIGSMFIVKIGFSDGSTKVLKVVRH